MDNTLIYLASKYGFHDTTIHNILCDESGLILFFNDGIYVYSNNGFLEKKTSACKLKIVIQNFDADYTHQSIIVTKIHKTRSSEIKFSEFVKLLKNNTFRIYLDFYSFFSKTLRFDGNINGAQFDFLITDIDEICVTL